jgi:serine/threonine-protein kinase
VGLTADGRAFIAMELLDGEPLHRHLAGGPLPVRIAVEYGRQLAAALEAAHAAGVIHRDLKPANVIVGRDGRLKLVDFGIAKLAGTVAPTRTATGVVLGTPDYMSPEQCAGQRDIDARSDLYSLGCVIFAMLTTVPPFQGETGAVIGMHQFVAPPRLRARCPSASPALEAVVDTLLAKSPAARFQTASEVAVALAAPAVVELRSSAGVAVTADIKPEEAPTAPSIHVAPRPAPAPPPPPIPPAIADAKPTSRRTAWILGIVTFLAAFAPLLVWQCNKHRNRVAVAAADAAPAPPRPAIDAAVEPSVVVTAPVDARTSTHDARVATGRRTDARNAAALVADAAVVARAPIDASSNTDEDLGLRTFVSDRGSRLVFAADGTVMKTEPDVSGALTGRYTKRPRKGAIHVEWTSAGADHPARERFVRVTCGLERAEWEDSSGGRHEGGERYTLREPPCTDDD